MVAATAATELVAEHTAILPAAAPVGIQVMVGTL
tara:strand:+ start:209 stop:310 length:102 start_codon:yes stop_codon:yes gene_type:complete